MPVRKQVCDLTAADFALSSVWEFALDEEFALADGTLMMGYLTPPVLGDSGPSTLQPIIITPAGQVAFWCGMIEPDAAMIAGNYARLEDIRVAGVSSAI